MHAMTRQQATFEKVATVTTRDQNGSIVIPVQEAVDRSGNAGGGGLIFDRSNDSALIGTVVDGKPDGRKHELARAINKFGRGDSKKKSTAVPPAGLEHLGIDQSDAADGVDLDLWVCTDPDVEDPLIAVTPAIRQTMQFDIGGESA